MKINSSAFEHNSPIPAKYTCQGEDVNPPLQFTDVPKESKSLALIVDDPDAMPAGMQAPSKTWVHWVVYNIPPSVTTVGENSEPKGGTQADTDFGKDSYGGPCPPSGVHRYFFKLYALDTTLDLPEFADKAMLEEAMKGHVLEQAELMGLYQKS
ncbi:MAG: YbhB/YbcL family Raf kinase inhibitor-like protein [Candidatus Levybacteria bacterium]|nr:YbhB/YbcL family Raf kinase inhibitor-like protein [Candidatus Levybacteria bacterium]